MKILLINRKIRSYDNFMPHYYSNIEKWARLEEVYTIVKVYSSVKLLPAAAAAGNFPLLHIWVHCENDNSSWIQSFFLSFFSKWDFKKMVSLYCLLEIIFSREYFVPFLLIVVLYKETLNSAKLIREGYSSILEARNWKAILV